METQQKPLKEKTALEKYNREKVTEIYQELRNERTEWESEWRAISSNILPGRGVYQLFSKPLKRKLTTDRIINTVAEDSLQVLVAGIHGSLTSPAMPWFRLEWPEKQLNDIAPLKAWLEQSEAAVHAALHASNFYSVLPSFYTEYSGFGTATMYVGEDSEDSPFRFELLTAGEYVIAMDSTGHPDVFARTIYMSQRQMVGKFGDKVRKETQVNVKEGKPGIDVCDLAVVEFIVKEKFMDKKYLRVFYEVTSSSKGNLNHNSPTKLGEQPLLVDGFYEFPYPTARWNTIGSDTYGIGPGSRALNDVRRLQEMEKSFLMATHKNINPPLNVPTSLRGKVNSLPGGLNYYSDPSRTVNELYAVNFDYQGVSAAIERVEQRIQRNFFNDVFLTASRDPNASPLKATQVQAQEQEKLFRLGPVTQRLVSEALVPIIRRCFSILLRKGLLPQIDPVYEPIINEFKINLVSPMAVAQNAAAAQGTDAFMGFIAQAAQFDPEILDNIDVDEAARQRATIEGVDLGILRPQETVDKIRKDRAEAQAAAKEREQQLQNQQALLQGQNVDATTRKTTAETGQILAETQETAIGAGLQ